MVRPISVRTPWNGDVKLYCLPSASSLAAHIVFESFGVPCEATRMGHRNLKSPACPARHAADPSSSHLKRPPRLAVDDPGVQTAIPAQESILA